MNVSGAESARRRLRIRLAVEVALTAISVGLFALTMLVPQWIEGLTGEEPDGGSGELELLVSAAFAVAAVAFAFLARRDVVRLHSL